MSGLKIFGLCGLKGHIVEIRTDVTLVDERRTERENRARILETEYAIVKPLSQHCFKNTAKKTNSFNCHL